MATNFDKAMVPYNTDAGMDEGPDIEIEIEDPESVRINMGGVEVEIDDEDDGFDENLAEDMSDSEEDDEDISDFEEERIDATLPEFPVNVICMEYCENTFDDLILSNNLVT